MIDWIHFAVQPHFHLGWNLFLALVPLVLAFWLFRRTQRRAWLWWPFLLMWIVFLPNAAYTLTDVIHFIEEVRYEDPRLPEWSVAYVVIPKYALFIFLGFQSHVISLILHGRLLTLDSSQAMGSSRRVGDEFSVLGRRVLGTIFAAQ